MVHVLTDLPHLFLGADMTLKNIQGVCASDLSIFRLHKNSDFVTKVYLGSSSLASISALKSLQL